MYGDPFTIQAKCCGSATIKPCLVKINRELVIRIQRSSEVPDELHVRIVYDGPEDQDISRYMTWVCSDCEKQLDAEVKKEHIPGRQARCGRARRGTKGTKFKSLRDVDWGRHPSLHT